MNKLIESNKRLRALKYSDVPPEHVSILESVSDE